MSDQSPPAAWYADPFGRHERRYWDGAKWTEHVGSRGVQGVDPTVETPVPKTPQINADWYPDPYGRHEVRYWNGSEWTEHVTTRGMQGIDSRIAPPAPPAIAIASVPPTPAAESTSPAGRPSRGVAKQARRVTAGAVPAGGGTLFTEQVLVVNQKSKLVGKRMKYAIFAQSGQQLGAVEELRRDFATKMSDNFRGRGDGTRGYRFQVADMAGRTMLSINRPELGWFKGKGKLIVEGPTGAPLGQIALESYGTAGAIADLLGMNSTGKHARFGLEANGQRIGEVHAEDVKDWNFYVHDTASTEIAKITKTWAGWAKERFTKSDNYVVLMHRPLAEPLRSLVIASALAIDFEFKQFGSQTNGSSIWGTRRYN